MIKSLALLLLAGAAWLSADAQLVAPNPQKHKPAVDPLLHTQWAQGDPYNLACPSYTRTNSITGTTTTRHYAVGCVPVALSQIMNHYRYPVSGRESIHRKTILDRDSIHADFENTVYDWENMLDIYPATALYTASTPSVAAVSTLLAHVSVALGTIYQPTGSSTVSSSALRINMARYFDYDADSMKFLKRSDYTKEQWMDLIFTELSKGRPIYYSGNSAKQGAHAWVIDGYNAEGKVHINWGWRGNANGYYDVDLDINNAETDFVTNHAMMIGIVPKQSTTHIALPQPSQEATSIEGIYTLEGIRREAMQPGLNIIRYKDGRTRKVLMK